MNQMADVPSTVAGTNPRMEDQLEASLNDRDEAAPEVHTKKLSLEIEVAKLHRQIDCVLPLNLMNILLGRNVHHRKVSTVNLCSFRHTHATVDRFLA